MKYITNILNCKAELWGMVDIENELGETDRKPAKIKDIYCNILPAGYSIKELKINDRNEHTHKFTVRYKSFKNPQLDMFFEHNGLKYEVLSWDPDFKSRDFYEVFTKLILE